METAKEINVTPIEFCVGTKEYRAFRHWLSANKGFSTRRGLASLKNECLQMYLKEYHGNS